MPRLTRLARVGGPGLLVASGLLFVAAAWERWSPACPFADFESGRCQQLQDHAYDFLPPIAPWTPIGDAAAIAGVAFVVLAVAVAWLPTLLLAGRYRRLAWASAAVLSGSVLAMGVVALASARSGRAELEALMLPGAWLWIVGWPVVLVTVAVGASVAELRGGGWRAAVVFLLCASTPFGMVFAGPIGTGYSSYDTAPWTEAIMGYLLILTAPALWAAAFLATREPRGAEVSRTEAAPAPG